MVGLTYEHLLFEYRELSICLILVLYYRYNYYNNFLKYKIIYIV